MRQKSQTFSIKPTVPKKEEEEELFFSSFNIYFRLALTVSSKPMLLSVSLRLTENKISLIKLLILVITKGIFDPTQMENSMNFVAERIVICESCDFRFACHRTYRKEEIKLSVIFKQTQPVAR